MKTGFPRPRTHVGTTTSNPYDRKRRGGSFGREWNDRDYPHPYTASSTNVASIDRTRLYKSVHEKLCGTCGEYIEEDMVGLILFNTNTRASSFKHNDWIHSETGPYHLKCLVLNFTMCPMLAKTKVYMPGYGSWEVVGPMVKELFKS